MEQRTGRKPPLRGLGTNNLPWDRLGEVGIPLILEPYDPDRHRSLSSSAIRWVARNRPEWRVRVRKMVKYAGGPGIATPPEEYIVVMRIQ